MVLLRLRHRAVSMMGFVVLLVNQARGHLHILDSCQQPFVLLQQADALLAAGGRLILACPFSYVDQVTPVANQISEDFVTHFLRQRGYTFSSKDYNWSLKPNDRTVVTHRCLAIDARKSICE